MDATTANITVNKYLATYVAFAAQKPGDPDVLWKWASAMVTANPAFSAEYTTALNVAVPAFLAAEDSTQLAADAALFASLAAAQGLTGTLT